MTRLTPLGRTLVAWVVVWGFGGFVAWLAAATAVRP